MVNYYYAIITYITAFLRQLLEFYFSHRRRHVQLCTLSLGDKGKDNRYFE